jgi:hypothetical protein
MSQEKVVLRGNRVYLELPATDNSKVIVDHNTKEALQQAFAAKMLKATVYAVGDVVTDLKPGDVVLAEPIALGKAPIIPIDETTTVVLVSSFDIVHKWLI